MPDKTRSVLSLPRPNLSACSCHAQTVFILTACLLVKLEKLNKLSLCSNHLRYFQDCSCHFLVITLTGKANNNHNNVIKWSLLKKITTSSKTAWPQERNALIFSRKQIPTNYFTLASRIFTVQFPWGFSPQNSTEVNGHLSRPLVESSRGLLARSCEVVPWGEVSSITMSPRRRCLIESTNCTCSNVPTISLSFRSYV